MLKTPETTEKFNTYFDMGIRFIHNTKIGCTIAYALKNNFVYISASFCAKQGYNYPRPKSSKPDQYSRKIGRAVAGARVAHLMQTGMFVNIPYVVFLKGLEDNRDSLMLVEETIHKALNFLESIHSDYIYNHVDRLSQIENEAVINNIYSLLITAIKTDSRSSSRFKTEKA
jgi:hypothetical protein